MKTQITPQALLQQASQIQQMERGKLCVIRQGPQGPYYNHQSWENGKNVSRYVPQDQVPALQQALAGYERFQNLMQQYTELIVTKTRAELADGSKKKPPLPSSSWPKTRKSAS